VLGLDFGGTKIAAAVGDLSGRRLAEAVVPTVPHRGARWNFECGLRTAQEVVSSAPGSLQAVCACTFGIPTADGVQLAPAIDGWSELALAPALQSAFDGATVRLATDVKAAAEAEARFGALAGVDPGVYLNLGTGLAAALVCGGTVVAGAHGAAGEIGYSLRRADDVGRSDASVLEDVVSGMALASLAGERTGERRSAAEVFGGAAGDGRLAGLVDDFVAELSFQLVNLAIAIDPRRIVVGGGMVRSWDVLERPLRAALETHVPYPPELVVGTFPFDAPLVGALALAADAATAGGVVLDLQSDTRSRVDRGRSRA
jgi:glucokinase